MINSSILEGDYPELFFFIAEGKVPVYYVPETRSFSILIPSSNSHQEIAFFPWSGKRLPKSLNDELFDLIENQGLTFFDRDVWPQKWRTEAWWIEAGL